MLTNLLLILVGVVAGYGLCAILATGALSDARTQTRYWRRETLRLQQEMTQDSE